CERVVFPPGYTLNVDQLLDDLLQRLVVQLELAPQHPQGQAAGLLKMAPHLADHVEEIHRVDSASSCAVRSACPVAPISANSRCASASSGFAASLAPVSLYSSERSRCTCGRQRSAPVCSMSCDTSSRRVSTVGRALAPLSSRRQRTWAIVATHW